MARMRDLRMGRARWMGAWLAAGTVCLSACHGSGTAVAPQSPAGSTCPSPSYPAPAPSRPRYRLAVRVPAAGDVTGSLRVTFTPDLATDRLVFRLWPNGPRQAGEGALLTTGPVRSAGRRMSASRPDPTTLVVRTAHPLASGQAITVSMPFRLRLPGPALDRLSRHGSAVRLGSFFPILAWEAGVGWDTDPPTSSLAEASSSPTADFDVRVSAPPGAAIVASGVATGPGRFTATAVRDFALAVGGFDVATTVAHAPNPIRVVAAVQHGQAASAADVARRARAALEALAARFGPYPWPELHLAVVPDLGRSGIEYPTMIFLGAAGIDRDTTHEVAHQWFYSLVGNDQARDPVLDEGLATYAQAELDRIWPFFDGLPDPIALRRLTGAPMRIWDRRPYREYELGVYVDGARALRALGPTRLVDCALRRYVAASAYGIATQERLVGALSATLPGAAARLRARGLPFG